QLQLYPYLQLLVITLLLALAFFALNRSRRAEQNSVWVGLSKETAHQLGTPISSLVAWLEYLRLKELDPTLLKEIDKDGTRLQMISEWLRIAHPLCPRPVAGRPQSCPGRNRQWSSPFSGRPG
ncbi:MAG: hypothetical protein WC126_03830, partial [Proteiniphilum sp.]